MFEYAISFGEGTLLDYGVANSSHVNIEIPDMGREGWGYCSCHDDGDISVTGDIPKSLDDHVIRFRPAPPDCVTGK